MLSKGMEIEHSNFEAENAALKGEYLRQVVEIVIHQQQPEFPSETWGCSVRL
jgi:hypothetical protein